MMEKTFYRFLRCESGATAIEYALLGALVAMGVIGAVTMASNSIAGIFGHVSAKSGNAMAGAGNAL